jgi:hypothetical protein
MLKILPFFICLLTSSFASVAHEEHFLYDFSIDSTKSVQNEQLQMSIDENEQTIQNILLQYFDGLKGERISPCDIRVRDNQVILNLLLDEQERLQRKARQTDRQRNDFLDNLQDFSKWNNDISKRISALDQKNADIKKKDIMNPLFRNDIIEFTGNFCDIFNSQTNVLKQTLNRVFEDIQSIKRIFFKHLIIICQNFNLLKNKDLLIIGCELFHQCNEAQIKQSIVNFNGHLNLFYDKKNSTQKQIKKILALIEDDSKHFEFIIIKTRTILGNTISQKNDQYVQIMKRFNDCFYTIHNKSNQIFSDVEVQFENFFKA